MKMITRTISERKYSVMSLNIKTAEVFNREYSLGSATFKGAESALKALKERFDTADEKLVAITSTSTADALYAMSEEAFIKAAIRVADVKEARAWFKAHGEDVDEVEPE